MKVSNQEFSSESEKLTGDNTNLSLWGTEREFHYNGSDKCRTTLGWSFLQRLFVCRRTPTIISDNEPFWDLKKKNPSYQFCSIRSDSRLHSHMTITSV